jgi:hypothetical protein
VLSGIQPENGRTCLGIVQPVSEKASEGYFRGATPAAAAGETQKAITGFGSMQPVLHQP